MRGGRNSTVMAVLSAMVVAGLAVSGFFMHVHWLSALLSLAVYAAAAVSLGYVNSNSFLFTTDSKLLYLPFMMVSLALPHSQELTLTHAAVFLTVWTIYYALMFVNGEGHRLYHLFMSALTSAMAALMVPSLLFVCVFILLYCVYLRGQDVMRLLMAGLSAVVLPVLYILAWMFIFPGEKSAGEFFSAYAESLVPVLPSLPEQWTPYVFYLVFIVLFGIRALIFVLSKSGERNKAQKNAFGLSVALSVIVLLCGLFFNRATSVAVALVPFSFPVFDFLTDGRKAEVRIWMSLLILLTAALRVQELWPVI
ncbi:MAG TPA: hypothetical protein IAC03_02740 [Candidatus Coprenecus pullistercoris]|nr:hypothetical protein [Candidatus Coprenecus pullistercoris]